MFRKLLICLAHPKQIALYLFDSNLKTVLTLLICVLIAVSPQIVTSVFDNEVTNSDEDFIKTTLFTGDETDIMIKDKTLTGSDSITLGLSNFVLFINPKGEKIDLEGNIAYESYPVIEFSQTEIKVLFLGKVLKSLSYEKINLGDLDFHKIMSFDYLEFLKLMNYVNEGYQILHPYLAISNSLSAFFETAFMIFFTALILGFVSKLFNPLIIFRVRFKIAMNCQFIFLLCIFFAGLYGLPMLIYIGSFLAAIYTFKALRQIVRIEIRKNN